MENLITKTPQWNIKNNGIPRGRRKGESTKRKCLKGKRPRCHLRVNSATGFEIAPEKHQFTQSAGRTGQIAVLCKELLQYRLPLAGLLESPKSQMGPENSLFFFDPER
jgi:hypothetical protein